MHTAAQSTQLGPGWASRCWQLLPVAAPDWLLSSTWQLGITLWGLLPAGSFSVMGSGAGQPNVMGTQFCLPVNPDKLQAESA